ncbi:divalent metal cation transporter [Streptomyces albulus]|nr:divalent metal cation transporter [Streptomyces noursei]
MTETTVRTTAPALHPTAVLDDAHTGDIRGALGTIRHDDTAPRRGLSAKLKTLLAVVGPGLIVMVGDNDAGAFTTYGQAGQNYGTHLLWTLLLLVPVLYVNQEMVLRLGAVTGVGHARLILERFGKFWGAFSVIDLFLLNALTLVTEFIGITLAAGYLGLPKVGAVLLAAAVIIASAFTGSFRGSNGSPSPCARRPCCSSRCTSWSTPSTGQMAHDFVVPHLPGGPGGPSAVMLLIIGIVGTTVAPWQLFFQQSYVIDKRITPRFMGYEKADLWIGIAIVVLGAAALMGALPPPSPAPRAKRAFTDTAGIAHGLAAHAGKPAGCAVRHRTSAGRLDHRRLRGVAVHRVRHRRRPSASGTPAPRRRRRSRALRCLTGWSPRPPRSC